MGKYAKSVENDDLFGIHTQANRLESRHFVAVYAYFPISIPILFCSLFDIILYFIFPRSVFINVRLNHARF